MITSAFDEFTPKGTTVSASGVSKTIGNNYNNNSICEKLYLVVARQAGSGTVGVKLQHSWDGTTWTDVVDFGDCTEDANGFLVNCKVPKGKPTLGKFLRLYYTVEAAQTLGAFLTFGTEEAATDVVANPAYNPFGKAAPTVE